MDTTQCKNSVPHPLWDQAWILSREAWPGANYLLLSSSYAWGSSSSVGVKGTPGFGVPLLRKTMGLESSHRVKGGAPSIFLPCKRPSLLH